MKDYPIIFSDIMVSALLEGRKTQTRRIVNKTWKDLYTRFKDGQQINLWVRETAFPDFPKIFPEGEDIPVYKWDWKEVPPIYRKPKYCLFRSGSQLHPHIKLKWKSPLFLPRWASRITLEVIDVKLEKIQNISEEDAKAEGSDKLGFDPDYDDFFHDDAGTFKTGFFGLWKHIHGWASLKKNPTVLAITFKVIKQNIDEIKNGEKV